MGITLMLHAVQRVIKWCMVANLIVTALLLVITAQGRSLAHAIDVHLAVTANNTTLAHHSIEARGSSTAEGGFIKTCAYPGAKLTDHYLGVYCLNLNQAIFGYNYTVIDLKFCVGNGGGTLVGYPKGNYSDSCFNCNTTHNSTLFLECDCLTNGKTTRHSTVDLNNILSNQDGASECYGYMGNKTWISAN